MSITLNVVNSTIKGLSERRLELLNKLELIERLQLDKADEEEVAKLVGEYMIGDIDKDAIEDEFEDLNSKIHSLEDIKETITTEKKLDSMQEAFLNSMGL